MSTFSTRLSPIVVLIILFLRQGSCLESLTTECATVGERTLVTQYCGILGFRCIGNDSYQLCFRADADGETEPPEAEHLCPKFTRCDEENPVFCTPIDLDMTTINSLLISQDVTSEHSQRQGRACATDADVTENRDLNEPEDDSSDECPSTTPVGGTVCLVGAERELRRRKHSEHRNRITRTATMPMTSESTTCIPEETSIEPETTTDMNTVETTPPIYDCLVPGFFPDPFNCTGYFACEPRPEGKGFLVTHEFCEPGRVFMSKFRNCVLRGTISKTETRLEDNGDGDAKHLNNREPPLQPEPELFRLNDQERVPLHEEHIIQPDNDDDVEQRKGEKDEKHDRLKNRKVHNDELVNNLNKNSQVKLQDSELQPLQSENAQKKREIKKDIPIHNPSRENHHEVPIDSNIENPSEERHDLSGPDSQYGENSDQIGMKFGAYDEIPFQCPGPGEIPDPMDETVFYLCRKKRGAKGYHTTRMICPPDTSFDPFRGLCSRSQRRKNDRRRKQLKVRKRNAKFASADSLIRTKIYRPPFSCTSEGRFPDVIDHNAYFLCFKNLGAYNAIHMVCPNSFHFNEYDNSCERDKDTSPVI